MKIGLAGYSGSGKSTLFHWLTGIAPDLADMEPPNSVAKIGTRLSAGICSKEILILRSLRNYPPFLLRSASLPVAQDPVHQAAARL